MVFRPYGPKWKNNSFRCGFVAPQPIRYASQKHILVRSVTYQCSNTSIRWKQGLKERLLKTFEMLFLADEVIWTLVFLGLELSLCSFWLTFMCKENSGRLYCWFRAFLELALWPSLSLSFGSWVHFSVFKGTVWYFQNIARVSPRQIQQWTLRLRRPRPSPTYRWVFFGKYRALLAHGNILGSAKTGFSKRKFLDNRMYQSY